MAAQSSLTLNTKVYVPRGTQQGVSTWALVGDSTYGGATSTVTESVRGPNSSGLTRVQFNVKVPKAATADTACGCTGAILGEGNASIQIVVPSNFTSAERADFCDRIQALVAHAIFDSAVASLEPAWS
jgi:hypothetical protein